MEPPFILAACIGIYFLLIEPWERRRFGRSLCDRAFGYAAPPQPRQAVTGSTDQQIVPVLRERQWLRLLNDEPDTVPHLLIAGSTGHGKSTFARALLVHRHGEVVILSAKTDDTTWSLPFVTYDDDGGCTALAMTAHALVNHLRLRTADDLPLTVVIDDYPLLANEKELKEPLTDLLTRAARIGRSKRLRLVVLTQETVARAMQTAGQTAVLQNFARVEAVTYRYTLTHAGTRSVLNGRGVPKLAQQPMRLTPWQIPDTSITEDGVFALDTDTSTDTSITGIADTDAVLSEDELIYQVVRRYSKNKAYLVVGGNRNEFFKRVEKIIAEREQRS
jgi:hypothetical protein